MASKILHRFRRKVRKENVTEETAQDFPEGSELEDDTEGLSSRLSGTLSFDDADTVAEEGTQPDAVDSDPDFLQSWESDGVENVVELFGCFAFAEKPLSAPHQYSLLTNQLQENWKKTKGKLIVEKLMFEVTSANVVQDSSSKYVAYTINVIKSGMFDTDKALIVRRYTDFAKLNETLNKHFREEMDNIVFPRKKIRKNFTHETIAKRSRSFEQYLQHIHSIGDIRKSKVFLEFFYLRDLKAGQGLLRAGMNEDAIHTLLNALHLQEKLASRDMEHLVFTLSALSVCYQELDRLEEAQAYCERAVQILENQDKHALLVPLLQSNIRLSWKIAKDKRQCEAKLQQLQDAGTDVLNQPSLKEHLIKDLLE
ncbi:sorting nexin-21 isoform X1 [Callorhinchus milii]|uniref:Sorting nexin family member 21 n=1 Tax=Callorhinchus milii TaxID=7868 RepID=V9KYA7_CALMI|nr:sorting nexin-21 isoform X1 [Callorhinchus milii]XP_042197819.1 sorting nexin-21 isoform X1 [Callorhinchus milii]